MAKPNQGYVSGFPWGCSTSCTIKTVHWRTRVARGQQRPPSLPFGSGFLAKHLARCPDSLPSACVSTPTVGVRRPRFFSVVPPLQRHATLPWGEMVMGVAVPLLTAAVFLLASVQLP